MNPRVLQVGRLLPYLEKTLADAFPTHRLVTEPDVSRFLAERGGEFNALVTSWRFGADAALIDALPNLKVIGCYGVGYDTIAMDAVRRRGIPVSNTPDVLTDCVADLAFGLIIDGARQLSASDRYVRRGDWRDAGTYRLATRVSGKRLGILGLGRIGRAIAKRGGGFDMEVRYHGRQRIRDVPYGYVASLPELARWADFFVVACSGGADTAGLVSAEIIAAMPPSSFLINIARGSIVDERALVDALVHRRIAGAGLDVFADEPNVPPELMTLDNVVLTPHVGSRTNETSNAMADLVIANLRSFFQNQRLLTPVG